MTDSSNRSDDALPARSPWEDEASNWLAWARTPGHDVFPDFSPTFFDEIVPAAAGLTLEAGCGEGRVARELAARGHRVVGLDVSPTLARHARDAGAGPAYLAGDATALPFADATFQTVVAYNSLQTMRELDDMARAVREAGRVLRPGGCLCLCVAHPMTDVGRLEQPDGGEIVISGSYFERQRVADTVMRDGLQITFHGWTYTLENYMRALEGAGLLVERLREPRPGVEPTAATRHNLDRWRRVPMFLSIRALKPGPAS